MNNCPIWVEIINAADKEAEQFAVQVGNDTDPARQDRYPKTRCNISPACHLSENTLRILKRVFGRVTDQDAPSLTGL